MTHRRGQLEVRKRDGGCEPFDRAKLRRSLMRALREVREAAHYADPLAEAVAIHLAQWQGPEPPSTEYVFRCCQTVLRETGLKPVAVAMARYRRRREARREATRVRRADGGRLVVEPWQRSRVVATLRSQYGLGRAAARVLSCEVESRVLSLGYRVVDAELIGAVVRNELRAWGLMDEPCVVIASESKRDQEEPRH